MTAALTVADARLRSLSDLRTAPVGERSPGPRQSSAGERFGDRLARRVAARRIPDRARASIPTRRGCGRRRWSGSIRLPTLGQPPRCGPPRRSPCTVRWSSRRWPSTAWRSSSRSPASSDSGAAGWTALVEVVAHARRHDLLVIADAKRGDIDVSADAYGQAFFGGIETPVRAGVRARRRRAHRQPAARRPTPWRRSCRRPARAAGGRVRARAHLEPGRAEMSRSRCCRAAARCPTCSRGMTAGFGADGVGSAGLSDVGAVIGATAPERLSRMRELMPHAVFLLPGVGRAGRARGGSRSRVRPRSGRGSGVGVAQHRRRARARRE